MTHNCEFVIKDTPIRGIGSLSVLSSRGEDSGEDLLGQLLGEAARLSPEEFGEL